MNSLFNVSIESTLQDQPPNQQEPDIYNQKEDAAHESAAGVKCETQKSNISTVLSENDLKNYLKCISHYYEIFPEVKCFSLDPSRVRTFLLLLCHHRLFLSARRVAVLFPETLNAPFLLQLVGFNYSTLYIEDLLQLACVIIVYVLILLFVGDM